MKALLMISALLATACAVLPDKDKTPQAAAKVGEAQAKPQASIEAKQLAAEQEAASVTEVSFGKNSSKITGDLKARLEKVRAQVGDGAQIEKVELIAWSDQEYPSVHTKKLPKASVALADARLKAMADYLSVDDKKLSIKKHNMAERPNAFENFVSDADARIKKSLEISGVPNTDTSVKTPSKASKAMILVIRK